MTDPYQVLGISRGASDDDIKRAYRTLSRKYHPDANINNPNKAEAEERFKEIQQAYNQIMKERQQGYSGGHYYNDTYQSANQEESSLMQAALNLLRSRSYAQAKNILDKIPFSERNGRWYYFSAVANHGMGNMATAMEHIQRAVALEPSNMEYRQFQQSLQFAGTWYTQMGSGYERPYRGYNSFCVSLLCMEALCSCCCRPF